VDPGGSPGVAVGGRVWFFRETRFSVHEWLVSLGAPRFVVHWMFTDRKGGGVSFGLALGAIAIAVAVTV
jgi:hypothetical protein